MSGALLDFTDNVALITGGGQGLGRAYAMALAHRGAHVVVNDIGDGAVETVARISASGGRATAAIGSVVEHAEEIVATAVAVANRLDIVINNAGITGGGPFHLIPRADWDRLMAVQLGGTVNISRAAWPHLAASGGGSLLHTSSASAFGAPYTSHYAAAKAVIFSLRGAGRVKAWQRESA